MKENGYIVTLSGSADSGDAGRSSKSLARSSVVSRSAQSQPPGGKQPHHSPTSTKHQKVSIPLSRRPDCMYFVNGTCNKGENCIFRHNLLARAGSHDVCPNWIRYHSCDDQLCKKLHPKQTLKASLEEIEEFEVSFFVFVFIFVIAIYYFFFFFFFSFFLSFIYLFF